LETVQVGGTIAKGDTVTSDDPNNKASMTVVHTIGSNVYAVYETKSRAEVFDTFQATGGITGVITAITQPNVYCHDSKLLCYQDINTISHTDGSTETINIILRY
jgi:hypothetical protein